MVVRGWLFALVLVAACSSGGESSTTTTATTEPPASTQPVATVAPEPEEPTRRFVDGPLAEVCPDTIVVQTDGLPSVRLGPLYGLLADAVVDAAAQVVSGSLRRPDGTTEEVTLELRSGGPSVSFRPSLTVTEQDPAIHLAVTGFSDLAVAAPSTSSAVVALAGTSDAMVMWDPATYPDVVDLDSLRSSAVEIRYVTGELVIEFLVARGVLDGDQVVGGAENAIAGFVTAGGTIARQGDALIDPVLFPALPQWGRPIEFAAASAGGWADTDPVLAAAAGRLQDECLGRLVPIVQRSLRAYDATPGPTNELMAAARNQFAPLNRVSSGLLDDAAARPASTDSLLDEFGGVVGGFDLARLGAFAPALADALKTEVRPVEDVVDERFLDPAA